MRLLLFLARVFINTFGITEPTPKQEKQAAWFIALLLTLILVGIAVIVGGTLASIHHHH